MAIKNFKKIEDRKGYLVEDSDRQIFEKEIGKSYFGKGFADMIEFVLYDSSDNPLPQGESGKLVRYININDEESKKYFLVSQNEFTKKSNNAPEMLFDLEELIRDAGYNAGVFKTQITLLNRRVGKEEIENDKLWIHEISPSRTEIRLLPIKNTNNPSQDLLTRYDVFTNNGQFRDDTIYFIDEYIRSIDIERVFQRVLTSKGRVTDGQQYISLIKKEFKVDSVEILINRVKDKFIEAMTNFSNGKEYRITSNTYGQPKQNFDNIELSVEYIKRTASEILIEIINFYLPKRNILEKDVLTQDQQITFDRVKSILKTVGSNDQYDSSIPDEVNAQVRGCTDPDAENFNPSAQIDDGTCSYKKEKAPPEIIKGCTDPNALNYDEYATDDDGNCQYEEVPDKTPIEKITKTWYVWSNTADVKWKLDDKFNSASYKEYDSFTIQYNVDSFKVAPGGDVRDVPKAPKPQIITKQYYIRNISHRYYKQQGYNPTPDPYNLNPFPNGTSKIGTPLQVTYQDKSGAIKQSSTIQPSDYITICAKEGSVISMEGLEVIEQGVCGVSYPPPPIEVLGCTDISAQNYNPDASIDDGTCFYEQRSGTGSSGGGGRYIPPPNDTGTPSDRTAPRNQNER